MIGSGQWCWAAPRPCSVCGAAVLVEYGRSYGIKEDEYRYAAREVFYYNADDPSRRHAPATCVAVLNKRPAATAAVPNTPPVMETPRKRLQQRQRASEKYGGEL